MSAVQYSIFIGSSASDAAMSASARSRMPASSSSEHRGSAIRIAFAIT